ncbi:MAG: hypothetical protein V1778_05445 [bacterium]
MVEFTCPPDVADRVREFLRENVRTIDTPTTGRVHIPHGGYGRYTRYDVKQHDYAGGGHGGGGGFIEVLEIANPPDGRWGIVIHEWASGEGSIFTEWETIECARAAFARYWGNRDTAERFPLCPGYRRRIVCGALTPWFYAVGDEQLLGDYAFPEGLQDDPVYRFGRQFIVIDADGIPMVKTCMGTRFITRKQRDYPYEDVQRRLVYWDDGSVWDESRWGSSLPRPVEDGEMWITEALQQFRQLIAGEHTTFTLPFTDGTVFVGEVKRPKPRVPCAEGAYFLIVQLEGEREPKQGWVHDFKPSPGAPDIVQYVTQRYTDLGKVVDRIEIRECRVRKGGKKWSGVFLHPPR